MSSLSAAERKRELARLTPDQTRELEYDWRFWARPNQLPPDGDWRTWLILAGRGWGKSRTGAQWVCKVARHYPDARIALIGATAADARDVMVEGESGVLAEFVSPPWFRPTYEPSKRRLTWPNGAQATTFSADEPERLRGPQSTHIWADELAAWRYPETWDLALFGLRLGDDPRAVVTTTPKPTKIIKELVAAHTTITTKGTTFENKDNLAEAFLDQIVAKYQGTRLGRQELNAEILDDNPHALWHRNQIEALRVTSHPKLIRIVVAVDPQGTNEEDSAETGIVVVGKSWDGHYYVLEDATVKGSPHAWGRAAVTAYNKYQADRIVGEINNGGDMVEHTIKSVDGSAPFKKVHASRGKTTRAEPVAALCGDPADSDTWSEGRLHHVGAFAQLEDQLCEWEQGMKSPDRLDSMVWAVTELMGGKTQTTVSLGANDDLSRESPNIF